MREYWRKWPLAAWVGELPGESKEWIRIDGRRFVPIFQVAGDVGELFDAIVEELVNYRLARYLSAKDEGSRMEHAFRLKVIPAQDRPILMFDRRRNPDLPTGEAQFIADGEVYTGNFVKIALNVAHQVGGSSNELVICCGRGSARTRVSRALRSMSRWCQVSRTGRCPA